MSGMAVQIEPGQSAAKLFVLSEARMPDRQAWTYDFRGDDNIVRAARTRGLSPR